jgi:phospholipase C
MRRLWPVTLFSVAVACGGSVDVGPRSNLTADQAQQMRQACAFNAGTLPGLSLAKDAPLGGQIPIDTIVILMFENRSFDHLLGHLPDVGVTDVDVAPASASNNSSAGAPVAWYRDQKYCFCDTNHEWNGSHLEYDNGKNDNFVVANEGGDCGPDGSRAMSYYTSGDLPWLYGLASQYAISDRNFCSLLGPTFPNREYLYAATSYGRTFNQIFTDPHDNLIEAMERGKVGWHSYYSSAPGPAIFVETYTKYLDNTSRIDSFFSDAAAGMLSPVNFVDPDLANEYGGGNDFHPPGDVQNGEAFLKKVVDAVTASPQWPHLALIITFDENGGIYDHVPPPPACPPDGLDPVDPQGKPYAGQKFDRLGFRVPLIVVSPYAKPHHVSHVVTDHTSIVRFVEARFKIPALTARDANADPLYDMFDFKNAALLKPPSLPAQSVDQAKLDACTAQYPKKNILGDDGGVPDLAAPVDLGGTD